jgi:hypothetical protein
MNLNKISVFVFVLIFNYSCAKDENINKDKILGTWVSSENTLTVNFLDYSNLNQYGETKPSDLKMGSNHYKYEIDNDSITIQYSGKVYIYVRPTTHRYWLNGNFLTIDFSNKPCYGFGFEAINFTRQ